MAIFFSPPLVLLARALGRTRPTRRHAVRHGRDAARRELLHQFTHLAVLLEHLVDLLHARPGARGDPFAARAVDHGGLATLLRRHREDDRLDTVELALVDLRIP